MQRQLFSFLAAGLMVVGCGTAPAWMDVGTLETASKGNPAFTRLDENQDGVVTLQEYVDVNVRDYEATAEVPLHPYEYRRLVKDLATIFERLDQNGDHRLTVDEFSPGS